MNSSLQSVPLFSLWLALGLVLNLLGYSRKLSCLSTMPSRRKNKSQSIVEEEDSDEAVATLLDLPELAVENILLKLPPQSLVKAASVCKELHQKCSNDRMWQLHVQARWGAVVSDVAFKEWQSSCSNLMHVHANPYKLDDSSPLCKSLTNWPLSCIWSPWAKSPSHLSHKRDDANHVYMKWYTTLETGAYWFPAQVYNRENGHVGFLLSCYDAELCYDRKTDTFKARYPPHGSCSPLLEDGVSWQRLRKPPISTTAHELYVSSSLQDLRPGDHVEVQWRRNKSFPYGWWYGVVGHLESCDKDVSRHCHCHLDDMVWLEFNQYAPGSRWRRTGINRKTHTEKGDDADGFYAGIRNLSAEEATAWMQLWPKETLE